MGDIRGAARWAWFVFFVSACGGGGGGADDAGTDGAGGDSSAVVTCTTDEDCSDDLFCTGTERCAPDDGAADARGCVAGRGNPCAEGQECKEDEDRCATICADTKDADGDGHDAIECGGDDCDDTDPDRYPGNAEVCDLEAHDEDCDPETVGERDFDGDGFHDGRCCNGDSCADDCDDLKRSVNPNGAETCNQTDDDCDGKVDEGMAIDGFQDEDRDKHGDPDKPVSACAGTKGFSPDPGDCDDDSPIQHEAQVEVCDMVDNDCDELVDEETQAVPWYRDEDGDGYGTASKGTVTSCEPPEGFALIPGDCDDSDPLVNPRANEACNGKDDDCNGQADFLVGPGDFEDDDLDGVPDMACPGVGADCDDNDPTTYPGATELCDQRDNNCDGENDVSTMEVLWLTDSDGDGFGDANDTGIMSCQVQAGRVTRGGDCDDSDPTQYPGAADGCGGVDGAFGGALQALQAAERVASSGTWRRFGGFGFFE